MGGLPFVLFVCCLLGLCAAIPQDMCCWMNSKECINTNMQDALNKFYNQLGTGACFSALAAALCTPCSYIISNSTSFILPVCESTCQTIYTECKGVVDISNDGNVTEFCTGIFDEISATQIQVMQNSSECFALPDLEVVRGSECMRGYQILNTNTSTTSAISTNTSTTGGDPPKSGKKKIPTGSIILSVIGVSCALGGWLLYLKKAPGLKFEHFFLWRCCFNKEEEEEEGNVDIFGEPRLTEDPSEEDERSSTPPPSSV